MQMFSAGFPIPPRSASLCHQGGEGDEGVVVDGMLLAQNKETGKNLRGYSWSWTGETKYGTLYAVRRLVWVPRLVKASV
jgi:hypothetical protein